MNKQKFEAYLRDKLSILQEEEIDEIVAEYLQHIDMRVAEGVSEEEAIADFGDLNELVNDLLDAYKINRNERDFEKFENRVKLGLNTAMDFINRVASSIMKRSSNEVVTLIVEFLIVIFVVFLLNSFIGAVFSGFHSAFYFRPYFLTNLIRLLIGLVRVVLTTSVSLAIFYWFAKERVLRHEEEDVDAHEDKTMKTYTQTSQKEQVVKTASERSVDFKMNESEKTVITPDIIDVDGSTVVSSDDKKTDDIKTEQKDVNRDSSFENKTQAKAVDIPKPKKQKTFIQSVVSFNITIIRLFVALCLIPGIVIGVLMGIGYVMLLTATFSGYGSIGLLILFAGILLIYYYFTIVFIKFVGGKKA